MDRVRRITIMGAGNGGCTAAADLTQRGFEVCLYELPDFQERYKPVVEKGGIEFVTKSGRAFVKLKKVTSSVEEALDGAEVIMIVTQALAHNQLAQMCTPYLNNGQIVILNPGSTCGSLEFWLALQKKGFKGRIRIGETNSLTYGCRLTGPGQATLFNLCPKILLGVFPAHESESVVATLHQLYPSIVGAKNVLEAGLNNGNPVSHPGASVLNAGRIEYSGGDIILYKEGITPSVVKVNEAIDSERLALCRRMGYAELPIKDAIVQRGYSPGGTTLYETYQNSEIFMTGKGPSSLKDRYITEDCMFGLVFWASLGAHLKVQTPTISSIIHLASVLNSTNYQKDGPRTVEKLGMAGMTVSEINQFLDTGDPAKR